MISRYYHILSDTKHRHHHLVKNCSFEEGFLNSITATDNNLSALKYYFLWVESWSKIKEEDNLLKINYENIQKILMSLLKKFYLF